MQRSRLGSRRRSAESNVAVPGDRTKRAAKGKALKVALDESGLSAGETETGAGSHPEKDPNAGAAVGSHSNSAEETNAEMTEVSGKAPREFESSGRMEEAASTIAHRVAESALQEPRSRLISETSITDTRQGCREKRDFPVQMRDCRLSCQKRDCPSEKGTVGRSKTAVHNHNSPQICILQISRTKIPLTTSLTQQTIQCSCSSLTTLVVEEIRREAVGLHTSTTSEMSWRFQLIMQTPQQAECWD
ncbi:uncharacterized protein LOC108703698 [Xenopus laevis]|uniref:Uncharacterized protein LOC108703698 n=1 Tax=Xenopus laevis TaxID=8355 RepID=A0A8J1M2R9_XENLA|nr:uncharacterized protein LOC108703698 [Xenopus laevis]